MEQRKHYLHVLTGGGPADGMTRAADKKYHTYGKTDAAGNFLRGQIYLWDGNEPEPCDPGNWKAINCTDEQVEDVWFKVTMVWAGP